MAIFRICRMSVLEKPEPGLDYIALKRVEGNWLFHIRSGVIIKTSDHGWGVQHGQVYLDI